jgi:F-type H+-transporting ATPase subunit epsilon
MDGKRMKLEVLSPEKTLFIGEVSRVVLPGEEAPFMVLYNHAPIISTLSAGKLSWLSGGAEQCLSVTGGFVEVRDNVVSVCVELL